MTFDDFDKNRKYTKRKKRCASDTTYHPKRSLPDHV